MPTRIIGEYPWKTCGCWKVESEIEYMCYWEDFEVVLIEKATNYICQFCNNILIQVLEHWEEKDD